MLQTTWQLTTWNQCQRLRTFAPTGPVFLQNKCGHQPNAKKADKLNKHVGSGVISGEAVPIPIRHVCGDRRNDSDNRDEGYATAIAGQTRLCEEEDGEERFDQFRQE